MKLADKGYDADSLADIIDASGAKVVIPFKCNRTLQRSYDRHLNKERNLVELFLIASSNSGGSQQPSRPRSESGYRFRNSSITTANDGLAMML
jgi:hypothetical protein